LLRQNLFFLPPRPNPGLLVQDSGLNQDPLQRKYAFLTITWVLAIRMEHVRAPSKGLKNVFVLDPMVICVRGLLLNPANFWRDYALRIINFMAIKKHPRISILRLGPMVHGYNPAKVPKFKYKAWWYSIDRKFHADDK
jgi:hypothetical protein